MSDDYFEYVKLKERIHSGTVICMEGWNFIPREHLRHLITPHIVCIEFDTFYEAALCGYMLDDFLATNFEKVGTN